MKKNPKVIIGFVCGLVGIIAGFICPMSLVNVLFPIVFVLGVIGTVLGFITKKEINGDKEKGEGLRKAAVVLGIISMILGPYYYFASKLITDENYNMAICANASFTKDCKDNGDNTSTCSYMGAMDIKCKNENLPGHNEVDEDNLEDDEENFDEENEE